MFTRIHNGKRNEQKMIWTSLLQTTAYDFLRNHAHLGDRIMLMGRIRKAATLTCGGVTLQLPWDLIAFTEFEQFQDSDTDTSML